MVKQVYGGKSLEIILIMKKTEISNSYIAFLFVAKKNFGVYAIIEKCKDELYLQS